jgi:serine/threonine protein kinase
MESKPLPVGTTLKERYRITRLVAGGGMAWVYEVEELRTAGPRQIWAMKELRADAEDTHTLEEGRKLFEQEANLLVRLSHPNLPRVAAYFEEKGHAFLVMEFIHGQSLEKRLEQANAPLLEGQVAEWAIQICEVLAYLHEQPTPIIFRDMKPSNVMVTPQGRIKLIDFGIARTYKVGKRKDTVTMGSENYAAPEQWGKAQTDARADIYGLGATMYHLLTNVPPLPAFVPTPRLPLPQYNPAVTAATVAVVEKAMSENRDKRFASAREMQSALLECLSRPDRRRVEALLRQIRTPSTSQHTTPPASASAPASTIATPPVQAGGLAPVVPQPSQPAPEQVVQQLSKACPLCTTLNRSNARFCRRCGHVFVPPLPPVLAVVQPTRARWEYPLQKASILIGRPGGQAQVDFDVSFYDPDGYVSRNHARITADQRRYHVVDLGSANGTFVNGERLVPQTPRWLRNGDEIGLGQVVLKFVVR